MTDRELLEAAARAIGRSIKGWNNQHGVAVAVLDDDTFWQPLLENMITDCMGDALRLAVTLRISLDMLTHIVDATTGTVMCHEPWGDDHNAATRRAIVRAAAALWAP